MYKFIYICHVYISNNHFKSWCGKNNYKRSITERETDSRRRRTSNSSYTPAALQINTNKTIFLFQNITQSVQICFVFNTNKQFSSTSFKYSTKCTMNMEWRCVTGVKIHYLLFVLLLILLNKSR